MSEEKNLHAGHRKRMWERYAASGGSGFSDHEILEMLLYHTIPRGNTNETAHLLLDYFGSLEDIVNADVRELMLISGVGESSARMLSLMGETFRCIARQSCETPKNYDKTEKIIKYLQHRYVGETVEKAYLLLFDNGLRMLDCVCLQEGSVNLVRLDPYDVVAPTVRRGASAVVLAHNHPNGLAIPSEEDVNATYRLKNLLQSLNITLIEHLVFEGDRYLPILDEHNNSAVKHFGEPRLITDSFYRNYTEKHGEKKTPESGTRKKSLK